MESFSELTNMLRNKGLKFFDTSELDLFISEIESKYDSPIDTFLSLSQENEIVQLEFSFLTRKAIFDFTLKKNSVASHIFFLKDIANLIEDTTANGKTLKIFNGGTYGLFYKGYGKSDREQLDKYSKSIIREINKL